MSYTLMPVTPALVDTLLNMMVIGEVAHGHWDPLEAQQSSTWYEFRAVRMVLESLMAKLQNCTVRWFTDDQNVARILQVGSKTPLLQMEALLVFSLCMTHNVSIDSEWIPPVS